MFVACIDVASKGDTVCVYTYVHITVCHSCVCGEGEGEGSFSIEGRH